jgi:PAS domain S-box-containing protein
MPTTSDLAARFSGIITLQQSVIGAAAGGTPALLDLIVERTAEITGAAGAIVQTLHGDDLVFRAASGPLRRFVGAHIATEESLSGLCIRQNQVLRSDDALSDPRVDREAARDMDVASLAVAPLSNHEGPSGVLMVYSNRAHAFDDLDVCSLELLAGMTSSALMLARQLEERKTSEERYRLLFEQNVAGVFRTALDGRILDVNDALVQVFGYSRREELLDLRSTDLYVKTAAREKLIGDLMQQRSMTNVRLSFKRKDGSTFDALMNISLIPAADGEMHLLGTVVEYDAGAGLPR